MIGWVKRKWLAGALAGLCLSGCTSTSLESPQYPGATIPQPTLPQTTAPGATLPQSEAASQPVMPPVAEPAGTMAGSVLPPMPATVRVALVLPLQSQALGRAAKAVENGFMVAHSAERRNVLVNVVETGDAPQDVLAAYQSASANAEIIVGPLSRSGVMSLVQAGSITRPTIALAQPDASAQDGGVAFPQMMLMAALSIEDEARQVADSIAAQRPDGPVFIVSTPTAWQRRAARAFNAEATLAGLETETLEVGLVSGFLDGNGLAQLRQRIRSEKPALLFIALDLEQARQLREAIGTDIPLIGTSQLNPLAMADRSLAPPVPEMNGVRLIDIPWQLQPDHPAVKKYPRVLPNTDQRRSADLERLYALGIDAYRLALELAANRAQFELDGVTGRLAVQFGTGAESFRRIAAPAEYRDGMVAPVGGTSGR